MERGTQMRAGAAALRTPGACRLVARWCGVAGDIPQSEVIAAAQRVPETLAMARRLGLIDERCDLLDFEMARRFLRMAAREPRGITVDDGR